MSRYVENPAVSVVFFIYCSICIRQKSLAHAGTSPEKPKESKA
jgi:hypothetical protein